MFNLPLAVRALIWLGDNILTIYLQINNNQELQNSIKGLVSKTACWQAEASPRLMDNADS